MKYFTLAMYPYITKKYTSLFEPLLKKYGLTQAEVDVLAFLHNNPEYNHAQDIVDVRGISKGHVSMAVEKLVHKGYLARQPDPHNRRCNILTIDASAKKLVNEIIAIQNTFNQTAYAAVRKEDKAVFHEVLYQIYQNLGGGKG